MVMKQRYDFSPSVYHQHLLRGHRPALRYDGGDVKVWQRKLRKKLKELLGVFPSERVPLNVRLLWRREHRLGTIEKLVFRAEPGAEVPAYFCVPKNAAPPYNTFICLQGHSTGMHNSIAVDREDEGKPISVKGDRDFAMGCMERGIAAFCIEQRSFGERRELVQAQVAANGCHDAAMQALLLGRTLLGERVYDVDRGIDYLAARGDINMKTLGVMGNSGGGTTSIFAAAVLRRLRLAMPSCALGEYQTTKMCLPQCCCSYVPSLLVYAEMADVLGLFAPRPVVVVAGTSDTVVPLPSARKAFRHLQKIYVACDAADKCKLVVGAEGHRFYADQGWPVMQRFMPAR